MRVTISSNETSSGGVPAYHPKPDLADYRSRRFPNIYVIGHKAPQLTIFSQQVRALQLVWAIAQERGGSLKRARIVIVGGGVAGITAATAAALFGASVHVLERAEEVLHLQRGCHSRHIHPRIYDWPNSDAGRAAAELPILNWSVGTAHEVATSMLADYYRVRELSDGRLEQTTSAHDIRIEGDGVAWWERHEGQPVHRIEAQPDAIILAVGFGVEKTINHLPSRSYWRVDSLTQTALDSEVCPYVVVVGGTGDGGILDALRAKVKEFDHGGFYDECLLRLRDDELKKRLLAIEESAIDEASRRVASGQVAKEDIEDLMSVWLEERYAGLESHFEKVDALLGRVRPDTEVIWTGRLTHPISLNTQLLNRLLGWRLKRLGYVDYKRGSIESVVPLDQSAPTGPRYAVMLSHAKGAPYGVIPCHHVVLRYGTESITERSFRDVHKALEDERISAKKVSGLNDEIANAYRCLARQIGLRQLRSSRETAMQLFAMPEEELADPESVRRRAGRIVYRVRIWLVLTDRLLERSVSWVDYDLHPEYDAVHRRATFIREPEGGQQFRHWVNTYDDYWIRFRCSDGGEGGDWLSKAIGRYMATGPQLPSEQHEMVKRCLENLELRAAGMRSSKSDYAKRSWCDYVDIG